MIAVAAHGLNGDDRKAADWAASTRTRSPGLTTDAFFSAFPFRQPDTRERIARILARYGF
jgi:hypothetical protein